MRDRWPGSAVTGVNESTGKSGECVRVGRGKHRIPPHDLTVPAAATVNGGILSSQIDRNEITRAARGMSKASW
ncbi:hypothetical protein [Halomicrococcus sp. NG-SE-24]|uniref:hypothetical protein n=1 Tax=Halomicrococcus sp. NG-SE-24 TaxID=3436928 RepID=UPI003D991FA1